MFYSEAPMYVVLYTHIGKKARRTKMVVEKSHPWLTSQRHRGRPRLAVRVGYLSTPPYIIAISCEELGYHGTR